MANFRLYFSFILSIKWFDNRTIGATYNIMRSYIYTTFIYKVKNKLKKLASYFTHYTIERVKGEVSPNLEVNYANGQYMLDTENVNYSFGGLYTAFKKAFQHFRIRKRIVKNLLILGFGAGSVAHLLVDDYKKSISITGVEIDNVVIKLAHKYFDIGHYENLTMHHADAYRFAEECRQSFDMIVVDVFIDNIVPPAFHKAVFLENLNHLLSKDGILLFNKTVFNKQTKEEATTLLHSMEEEFGSAEQFVYTGNGVTNFILAHDRLHT